MLQPQLQESPRPYPHPRGSSIPRHYRQRRAKEPFTVADAAQLKLKLQALDDKLEPGVDIETLRSACQSRPFHEEFYVDGSEEFYLLVKSISHADLIPHVYIEAYATVQQGRFPLNHHRVSDFSKGVDPTFSEIRKLLSKIDQLCGTKLDDSYSALEDRVKPFPFLRLPAELALLVYSYLLPREQHIALVEQPMLGYRPPRVRLDIMRTSQQMHREVAKYFYENRTLFMATGRLKNSPMLSNEYLSRYYETLAIMNPQTRRFFTRFDIKVVHQTEQTLPPRRYQLVPSVADPMQHVFDLLPNLSTVVLSLGPTPFRPLVWLRVATQRDDTLESLLDHIPQHVEILWDKSTAPALEGKLGRSGKSDESRLWRMMNDRGSFIHGESMTARLEAANRKMLEESRARRYGQMEFKKPQTNPLMEFVLG
jgi:hypothetical protein